MIVEQGPKTTSAVEFVKSLFDNELTDSNNYDADVVSLVRDHLGRASVRSQAGVRLAADLVELAKTRARAVEPEWEAVPVAGRETWKYRHI